MASARTTSGRRFRDTPLFTELQQEIILSGCAGARDHPGVPLRSVDDVGCLIRRQRRLCGLSQLELARRAGVGPRFICDLESGKPTIQFTPILKVCSILELSLFGLCGASTERLSR